MSPRSEQWIDRSVSDLGLIFAETN